MKIGLKSAWIKGSKHEQDNLMNVTLASGSGSPEASGFAELDRKIDDYDMCMVLLKEEDEEDVGCSLSFGNLGMENEIPEPT